MGITVTITLTECEYNVLEAELKRAASLYLMKITDASCDTVSAGRLLEVRGLLTAISETMRVED